MRTNVRWQQVLTLLMISFFTVTFLGLVGLGADILAEFGPLTLMVILGTLVSLFLAALLISRLPFWIAKFAPWVTRDPAPHSITESMQATPAASDVVAPGDDIQSLFDGQRLAAALLYMFLYAAIVTAILVLSLLFYRLALLRTVTDLEISVVFGTEAVYFAALFAYVLIKHRRAGLRSS